MVDDVLVDAKNGKNGANKRERSETREKNLDSADGERSGINRIGNVSRD